ncbi:uncharacterized protein LOC132202666 [Neocloeon triangulifer]|uniref:uncharacterized protein LOC132202666 n=1 Tax=Neocloeon triangulifer TaxID=2078957 RepID=UPI00286F3BDD|nr:uncharacterized protein LOC132202666 [Neocloeon triangulifer]
MQVARHSHDSGSSSPLERLSPRKQASFRVRGGPSSRRRNSRALRATTVSALTSKFNNLSAEAAKGKDEAKGGRPVTGHPHRLNSPSKRKPPPATTNTAAPNLNDDLRLCHGTVKHTIKLFEKIETHKSAVPKEQVAANDAEQQQKLQEAPSTPPSIPKPKVMLKPTASFISRKVSELKFSGRKTNQVQPMPQQVPQKTALFKLSKPQDEKRTKKEEENIKIISAEKVPNMKNRSYIHSFDTENLSSRVEPLLPSISETSVGTEFFECDNAPSPPMSNDISLVDEVLKELESNKLIAECKVQLDELTAAAAKAQPNVSFLFSSSAIQQAKQEPLPETDENQLIWNPEDYDDVYASSTLRPTSKVVGPGEEVYDYPLPKNSLDEYTYDDCGPSEGIYEDTATVYESIGSCAPSYFEKNSLYGGIEMLRALPQANFLSSSSSRSPSLSSRAEINCDGGRSESERQSETGSDEWMDLEISEPEEKPSRLELPPIPTIHKEKTKNRRSPSWSLKVRQQWTHSLKRRPLNYSNSNSASDDNHYESLYEMLPGDRTGRSPLAVPTSPPPPPPIDETYDSDITDSSFDSDSDTEFETVTLRRNEVLLPELPPPPASQTGGMTKFAEAASKKMKDFKKTWKRGIGDKLRRLSTPNPVAIFEAQNAVMKEQAQNNQPTNSATTPTKEPSKKYWTFRKNSKASRSPNLSTQKSTDSASSIFYVGTDDLEIGEKDDYMRHSVTEAALFSGPSSSSASLESENVPRRHSSSVIRPKTPPPPPPTDAARNGKSMEWYAEIELSSLQHHQNTSLSEIDTQSQRTESSDDVASNNNGSEASFTPACFEDEPLYQFYAESVLQQAQRELNEESDSDGYEEIGEKMISRPSAMELIKPQSPSGQRSLWCEIPDVINSGVLDRLNQQQRKLQEAKFEIITSEASYIKSLNVLVMHFVLCPELQDELVLSKTDRDILFSGIRPVKSCSERFLADLEKCWQESILLTNICNVMERHAAKNLNVYIKYCSQQIYLDRTLKHLRQTNSAFSDVLTRLESDPECQALSLHSFLMLPMQRVTRLPLLFDAVLRRLNANTDEYNSCKNALMMVNKLVQDCNEEARKMERMKDMIELSRQLEFKSDMRAIPLISTSRWLVRSGEMTQLLMKDEAKLTFGRKFAKQTVFVFLFTDYVIVAKRKGEEGYQVLDYCARNMVEVVNPEDYAEGTISLPWRISDMSSKNMLLLTLLQNHEKKMNEMVLSCQLESDKQRWLAAFTTPQTSQENPEERVYESWDCPQVQAIHAYVAQQPDELSLEVADVVNVLRKLPDGWYQGERIRDGECGWFPENYCKEILSSHVRARNLRQRYRLLALTSEFIDGQRKARLGTPNNSKIKLTSSEKLEIL